MHGKFVFDTMHGRLDRFLEIKETDYAVSTQHFNCQFLLPIVNFYNFYGEATKISILSND